MKIIIEGIKKDGEDMRVILSCPEELWNWVKARAERRERKRKLLIGAGILVGFIIVLILGVNL